MGERSMTKSWNVNSESTPALTRVQRMDNRQYTFCQLVDFGSILTSSAGAATFYGTAFNLNNLAQVSSIQALFDQYKIEELEVWITPSQNNAGSIINNVTSLLYSAIDYDSSAAPGSINQITQYQNVMESSCTTGHYRRWRPHVGSALGIANTTVQGMANIPAPWIDSLTPGVNHQGLVLAMTASSTSTVLNLRVRLTISVRNVF